VPAGVAASWATLTPPHPDPLVARVPGRALLKREIIVPRILLLIPTRTYRTRAFMRAARRLGAEVVIGSERRQVLSRKRPGTTAVVDFRHPERALAQIVELACAKPFDAVVGVDDDTTLVAAMAGAELGLPHNEPAAVRATRDKHLMRRLLGAAGVPSPWFELVSLDDDIPAVSRRLRYPCVLKPTFLSASRGVIRADTPAAFLAAAERISGILAEPDTAAAGGENARRLLIEGFIPGVEVALEGILLNGALKTLALFDKPDPLDGPYFEETIYVTPSRLPAEVQCEVAAVTARGAAALGLREGPVHAELRVNDSGAWIVEIAARSIGGLCSDTLEFSGGASLEELILLHATGADISRFEREPQPSGVMMLPIPRAGVLHAVGGVEQARAVPGIVDVTISIPLGQTVVPLPEGNRYLGFVFARCQTAAAVEAALRDAHGRLEFAIT
jgi:biotin carboxylase